MKIKLPNVSGGIHGEHAFGEERILAAMCVVDFEEGDKILYINDGEQMQIVSVSNPELMLLIRGLSAGSRLLFEKDGKTSQGEYLKKEEDMRQILGRHDFGEIAAATAEALTSIRIAPEEKSLLDDIREGLKLFELLKDANKTLQKGVAEVNKEEYNSYRIVQEAFHTEETEEGLQRLVSSFIEEESNICAKLEELLKGKKLSEEDLKTCRNFFLKLAVATGL